MPPTVTVVGGGVFGVSAALALRSRGVAVRVLERAPSVPAHDAASYDTHKLVRAEYGADKMYGRLAHIAIARWETLEAPAASAAVLREVPPPPPPPPFHRVGIVVANARREAGGFERDSIAMLAELGHTVQQLSAQQAADLAPFLNASALRDAYFDERAGWVASADAVRLLAMWAREAGVEFEHANVARVDFDAKRLELSDGSSQSYDYLMLACGAWNSLLVPELSEMLTPIAQSVAYYRAFEPSPALRNVPAWAIDISVDGWYGFPPDAETGVIKIGNHGDGFPHVLKPAEATEYTPVPDATLALFQDLLDSVFAPTAPRTTPANGHECIRSRLCHYSDTLDRDFLFDAPARLRANVLVLGGDSGHAFKFGTVLGDIAVGAALRAWPEVAAVAAGADSDLLPWRAADGTQMPDDLVAEAVGRFAWRKATLAAERK